MLILLLAAPRLLPESRNPAPGRLDGASAALLSGAMLTTVYGLKHAAEHGWGWLSVAWILGGLALVALFARRQRCLTDPLIDITLFRIPAFSVAVLANIAGMFALTALLFYLPQYVQLALGHTPIATGLRALPIAAGAIAGTLVAATLARHIRVGWIIGGGLVIAAAGYLVLSTLHLQASEWMIMLGGAVIGIGIGSADALSNDIIVSTAPADKAGAAAGISETAYELGGALGTAIIGAIGASVYRTHMSQSLSYFQPPG